MTSNDSSKRTTNQCSYCGNNRVAKNYDIEGHCPSGWLGDRLGFLVRGDARGQGFRLTQANSRGEGTREQGWSISARRDCGFVIRDVNSDHQYLVAPDDRRQVTFAARVFEEADTPRFEVALTAVARADGRPACHHEHPLPAGTAMPATHPVWREAEESPLRGPGRRGNIEGGAGGANCSGATVMVAVSRCDSPASSENRRV